MPPAVDRRALVIASVALLAYWAVMAVVAIAQDWPAEFGTTAADDPETIWDWIWRGSLVHAPLPPIVAQVVLTLLTLARRRAWIVPAAVGLALLGCVYVVGFVGEPLLHPERSDPPVAAYVLVRIVGILLVLTMIALGVLTALRTLRRQQ